MLDASSCFVCTTPYQIITAINYVLGRKLEADIYIVPQFKDSVSVAENLGKLSIFNHVFLVDTSKIEMYKKRKCKVFLHLGIVINYLRIKSIVSRFYSDDIIYQELYVSSKANIGRLLRLYYIKKRYDFQTIYFDDGESSYDNRNIIYPSTIDYIIQRLLFGEKAVHINSNLLLYSPQLYKELNPNSKIPVTLLDPIKQDEESRQLFNKVFKFTESSYIKEDVIILDIIKEENLLKNESNIINKIYSLIINKFGKENTIIKKHPRDNAEEIIDYKYYRNQTIPFEVLLLNMNLQNKILITISSTAVTIPKLLFGQEPKVIYLGNLVKTKQGNIANKKGYYEACRKMYSNPDYFMIPKTVEEFEQIIKNFSIN